LNILYNAVDITSSIEPLKVRLIDNAGGIPDSIDCVFSDTNELWSKWNPKKNDTLEVKQSGYSTGIMYIDELGQSAGIFKLKALSIPQHSKTAKSQGWENVRFLEFVNEIAGRYGFKVQTYGIENFLYQRVDQIEQADFLFLAYKCMLEGYAIKINNKNIVIYNENYLERKDIDPVNSLIYKSDILNNFEFKNKSTDIFSKCLIKSNGSNGAIQGQYEDKNIFGSTITKQINCSSQAEANRFAKGYLRASNKDMITGSLPIKLNTNYAAGTNIEVKKIGMFDGKYFIDKVVHDLINDRTNIYLRKPLEGY
jgi:phage protein D